MLIWRKCQAIFHFPKESGGRDGNDEQRRRTAVATIEVRSLSPFFTGRGLGVRGSRTGGATSSATYPLFAISC